MIRALLYKLQLIRALLKYRSRKYFSAYCFLRSALNYSPPNARVIFLFAGYVAILSDRQDLVCGHVLDFFKRSGDLGQSALCEFDNQSEYLWVTAFAQYLYFGCIESEGLSPDDFRPELRSIDFSQIDFQMIGAVYRKMFPCCHLSEVISAHVAYDLDT
jgi:hypothetical protein